MVGVHMTKGEDNSKNIFLMEKDLNAVDSRRPSDDM